MHMIFQRLSEFVFYQDLMTNNCLRLAMKIITILMEGVASILQSMDGLDITRIEQTTCLQKVGLFHFTNVIYFKKTFMKIFVLFD